MGGYALPVRSVTKICRVRRVSIAVTSSLSQREALRRACAPRRAWQPPSDAESTPMDAIVAESGASVMVEAQRKPNRYASAANRPKGTHVMTCQADTPAAACPDRHQASRCTPWPPRAATSLATLPRFCPTRGRRCAALARSARVPVATAESTQLCAAARRRRRDAAGAKRIRRRGCAGACFAAYGSLAARACSRVLLSQLAERSADIIPPLLRLLGARAASCCVLAPCVNMLLLRRSR